MNWTLPKNRELDSYGEDIDIFACGIERPNKCPAYKRLGLAKNRRKHLTLVIDNTTKDKKRG